MSKRQPWTKKSYVCCEWEYRDDPDGYSEIHLPKYDFSYKKGPDDAAEEWYENHLNDCGYEDFDGCESKTVMVREILEDGSYGPMKKFDVTAEATVDFTACEVEEEEHAKENQG